MVGPAATYRQVLKGWRPRARGVAETAATQLVSVALGALRPGDPGEEVGADGVVDGEGAGNLPGEQMEGSAGTWRLRRERC